MQERRNGEERRGEKKGECLVCCTIRGRGDCVEGCGLLRDEKAVPAGGVEGLGVRGPALK